MQYSVVATKGTQFQVHGPFNTKEDAYAYTSRISNDWAVRIEPLLTSPPRVKSEKEKLEDKIQQYLRNNPNSGYGEWDIHGEDPNCDLGGYHHEPFLGRVMGTYEEAVRYAATLSNFWGWGGGGSIRKTEVVPVRRLSKKQK